MPAAIRNDDGPDRTTRRRLTYVSRLIEGFRSADPEMPMQTAATLMIIALNEGCTLVDITERLGMASSSASRNVSYLSKVHRLGKPGLNLVETRVDVMDRRRKHHHLTPKGRALVTRLLETMED